MKEIMPMYTQDLLIKTQLLQPIRLLHLENGRMISMWTKLSIYYQRVSCPTLSMLQSTLLFENCSHVRVPTTKFVQIVNIHGNHLITLSNIDCVQGAIRFFDSTSNSTGLQNNDKFNCQVASLFNS